MVKDMTNEDALAHLHYELIQGVIRNNHCPSIAELAKELGVNEHEAQSLYNELASIHGVVLHPHACEPWVLHPFSLTPTINWIKGTTGSWWAPCVWCAFGVTFLTGGNARIHTRYGAEAEPVVIEVRDGRLVDADLVVHFAIPPARAWDNVHQHCSLVLPFRSNAQTEDWCRRYGIPMGEAVSVQRVADLAREWYGSHGDRNWRKWSVDQAQEIFSRVGLTSEFWRLASRAGHF
jgi:Alkylmercury lyase